MQASTLIMRDPLTGSQEPSASQIWAMKESKQLTFDKEFVKKHLFTKPTAPNYDKTFANFAVYNQYATIQGVGVNIDTSTLPRSMDTLVFLKLKKLLLARFAQGLCGKCFQTEAQHLKVCSRCHHTHPSQQTGKACGAIDSSTGARCDCQWDSTLNTRLGPVVCKICNHTHASPTAGKSCNFKDKTTGATCGCVTNPANMIQLGAINCTQFIPNHYETARQTKTLNNPFGSSGGRCSDKNHSVLLDDIEKDHFLDVILSAIKAKGGWGDGYTFKNVELNFGPNAIAEMHLDDTKASFEARAKLSKIFVGIKKINTTTYEINHLDKAE